MLRAVRELQDREPHWPNFDSPSDSQPGGHGRQLSIAMDGKSGRTGGENTGWTGLPRTGGAGVSVSQNFMKGVDAYERGDYVTALCEWTPLAEQGHAAAQFNLGNMYADGDGDPQH